MSKELPGFILRNCTAWVDRISKVGQIGDITLPAPKVKLEEMRNAGMIKPRDIVMGYEKLEASFKMPGLDPQILKLFGLKAGLETPLMITGALVGEDGQTYSAVANLRGIMTEMNPGSWKPGDMAENDYKYSVHYYKLEVDGEELIEMDDFDVKIGGVSQYGDIRKALML